MSNELTVVDKNEFMALNTNSDVAMAIRENFGDDNDITESDLLRVKIPSGGGVFWTVDGVSGEEVVKELELRKMQEKL